MVSGKQYCLKPKLGKVGGHVGRWPKSLVVRPRGLHSAQRAFLAPSKSVFVSKFPPRGGHVCKPRKCTIDKVRQPMAPSRCNGNKRIGGIAAAVQRGLCQPPLDVDFAVATAPAGEPPHHLPDGSPAVGWECLVAPVNSVACQGDPCLSRQPPMGDVPKLPGRGDAAYEMAPTLPSVIRGALQRKQVPPENIDLYLSGAKNISRYDGAFRKLWAFCSIGGVPQKPWAWMRWPAGF